MGKCRSADAPDALTLIVVDDNEDDLCRLGPLDDTAAAGDGAGTAGDFDDRDKTDKVDVQEEFMFLLEINALHRRSGGTSIGNWCVDGG